jgi:predicted RNase H-like nuclease (RuvC/YqgF family)
MSAEFLQNLVVVIITSGLVTGIFSLLTKRSKSPESQNDLARLGNDFAAQLLKEAQEERKELRTTIGNLEALLEQKKREYNTTIEEKDAYIETLENSIETLKSILKSKTDRIEELEARQQLLAEKLQKGEKISLTDIFGDNAPDVHVIVDTVA